MKHSDVKIFPVLFQFLSPGFSPVSDSFLVTFFHGNHSLSLFISLLIFSTQRKCQISTDPCHSRRSKNLFLCDQKKTQHYFWAEASNLGNFGQLFSLVLCVRTNQKTITSHLKETKMCLSYDIIRSTV